MKALTVAELIEELKKMPQDQVAVCFWGDQQDIEFTVSEVGESLGGPTIYLEMKS